MTWDMQACNAWAVKTFGEPRSLFSTIARANEEMAELIRECSILSADYTEWTSAQRAKVLNECADVAIIMFRVCDMMTITMKPDVLTLEPLGPTVTQQVGSAIVAANRNMALILGSTVPCITRTALLSAQSEVYWVYRHLATICKVLGSNLQDEIDEKMAINETRTFTRDADNNGYHVKQPIAA